MNKLWRHLKETITESRRGLALSLQGPGFALDQLRVSSSTIDVSKVYYRRK